MSGAKKLPGKTLKVPLNNYSKKMLETCHKTTTTKNLRRGQAVFFSVKNKWRQFDTPQMGILKHYSTPSHWRLAVKAGTQASEERGESAGG